MTEPKPVQQRQVWTEAFREFDALYEADAVTRAARVQALRERDPAVAQALEQLLAEHVARGSPHTHDWLQTLPHPAGVPAATPSAAPAPAPAPPERIGPWRLLRELGCGGTARVWLARREDVPWVREVALKVPLFGLLREDLRERLIRERDILSRLEHPHIARLYDAGFADAQPWLALEYVQGQEIVGWCDARRAGVRPRVELFRQVLRAVQYAHAALVVHRDIKPANILVNGEGHVRLLDFGIAKLMAEGQDHTQTTQLTRALGRMLTPAFASPEQLRGEPLTTATDTYSLGLVLYQLLTGWQPFTDRPRTPAQIEQAIVDGQIPLASRSPLTEQAAQARGTTPRSLRGALTGDLDAVLSKATQASPAARYDSVAAFDADLEAWLDGRPVRARRPTLWQHAAKLVRRHPWASGLGAGAVCALAATTVVAVVQASSAREQAQQARVEAARARSAKAFLLGLFDEANPDRNGGRDVSARELLTRGEQRIARDLSGQPLLQVDVLESIGRVWWEFGDMEHAARVWHQRSELAAVATPGRGHVEALLDESQVAIEAGDRVLAAQRLAAAQEAARRAGLHVPEVLGRIELRAAWVDAGARPPDPARALQRLEGALVLARQAGDGVLEVDVLSATAFMLRKLRRHAESVEAVGRAEERARALRAADPMAFPEQQLHVLRLEKARTLWSQGEYREGWAVADPLMRDVEAWVGTNSNRFGLLHFRLIWMAYLVQMGQLDTAAAWVAAHSGEFRDLPIADPLPSLERYRWLAKLAVGRGEWPLAAEMLKLGAAVPGTVGTERHAGLLVIEAEAQLRQLHTARGVALLDQAAALVRGAGGRRPLLVLDMDLLRSVAFAQAQRWPEAMRTASQALDQAVLDLGAQHPRTALARLHLALLALRRPGGAPDGVDPAAHARVALGVLQRCYPAHSEPLRLARALEDAAAQGAMTDFIRNPRAFVL